MLAIFEYRAIIHTGGSFNPSDLPLPRQPHEDWALFYQDQSPRSNLLLAHSPVMRLFNHTATFSRHSDLPLTLHHLVRAGGVRQGELVVKFLFDFLRDMTAILVCNHNAQVSDRRHEVLEIGCGKEPLPSV